MYETIHRLLDQTASLELLTCEYESIFTLNNIEISDLPTEVMDRMRILFERARVADRLMRKMGLPHQPLDIDDIIDEDRAFQHVDGLASNPGAKFEIGLDIEEQKVPDELRENSNSIVLGGWITIEDRVVAYAARGNAKTDTESERVNLRCTRDGEMKFRIVGEEKTYHRFFDGLCQKWKPKLRIIPDVPEFLR